MDNALAHHDLVQSCLATPDLSLLDHGPLLYEPQVDALLEAYRHLLFPGYFSPQAIGQHELSSYLQQHQEQAQTLLIALLLQVQNHAMENSKMAQAPFQERMASLLQAFWQRFAHIRQRVAADLQAAMTGDPAVRDRKEVILAYPGFLALTIYRIAHELDRLAVPLLPRLLSSKAHQRTGADIHPSAIIGSGCFIDHATGVVIGETAILGQGIKLYQGVTLGALSFPKDQHGKWLDAVKRHPTVEDHVTIYANATVLGGKTVIGAGSVLGASVFVTESVPPGSKVLRSFAGDPWSGKGHPSLDLP